MSSLPLLLIALVGHAAVWLGAVNRVHAIGLPKRSKDGWTNACFAVLLTVPGLLVWRCLAEGPRAAASVGFGSLLSVYLAVCVQVAAVTLLRKAWHVFGGERYGVVAAHDVQTIDLGADGGIDRLVAPGASRWFAKLPGNEVLRLAVEHKTLCVPGLPAALEGLKIAHLSDLHMSGRIGVDYYSSVVDLANDWRPDLVALTGDLVENTRTLDDLPATLGRLSAPLGVYFLLGNHDAHGDADQLRRRLGEFGHTDVGGRWVDIEARGATLRIAGNELPWFGPAADLSAASEKADATFGLVHSPDRIDWAQQQGASLVLAGHNHGGQIRFPLVGPIVAPSLHGVRYASGAFRHGNTVMHVTRGAGTLALLRWNCQPELSLLTLTAAPEAGGA